VDIILGEPEFGKGEKVKYPSCKICRLFILENIDHSWCGSKCVHNGIKLSDRPVDSIEMRSEAYLDERVDTLTGIFESLTMVND
jgi:hypothetical protein